MNNMNTNTSFDTSPLIMGILNITPDSFSTVGRFLSPTDALKHAQQMIADGVQIIDIGAEATNPALNPNISLQEELDRLLPVVELLSRHINVPISIDTSKPEVMSEAVKLGASMINDVRALRREGALTTVAKLNVPVCLMHMEYPDGRSVSDDSASDNNDASDSDIVVKVKNFLQERINACLQAGIASSNIIIDPGIGNGNFGKTTSENCQLVQRLDEFIELDYPILVGVSRKTFIGEILNAPPEERLFGSIVASVIAAERGASIIRTHDVKETASALLLAGTIFKEGII